MSKCAGTLPSSTLCLTSTEQGGCIPGRRFNFSDNGAAGKHFTYRNGDDDDSRGILSLMSVHW